MPVYLPTAVVGNARTLVTLGHSGEIMGWFYPAKDGAQNVYQCLTAVYHGAPGEGSLHWTYGDEWRRHQFYEGDTNICVTELVSHAPAMQLRLTDMVPDAPTGDGASNGDAILLRRIEVRNMGAERLRAGVFCYGDWNLGGIRTGNALRHDTASDAQNDAARNALVQSHREVALAIGGDALQTWQCGKAGLQWGSNALQDLNDGALDSQSLEIGDVNWAFGFELDLAPGERIERIAIFALARTEDDALRALRRAQTRSFDQWAQQRRQADATWLAPGLQKLAAAGGLATGGLATGGTALPDDLQAACRRQLLCLPLLCGEEGVAVAAPEFDPEFISCGGYGYHWPRDGAEYVAGLLDAGYPQFAARFFDWCARHQHESGLWHQRYFLNGAPGPNWCLPPDALQIDQVGAVLWAYGKMMNHERGAMNATAAHREMIRRAADYLVSRLTDKGVHANAFDTWESFIGSFTHSNAAVYAALQTAAQVLGEEKYQAAARRVQAGVLQHFVAEDEHPYLMRGFDAQGNSDAMIDSASLGAIEPFELLDLNDARELQIAEGTLRAVTEKLDVEWEDGRAIRRFEGDAYLGGVPACVNTLWMARCCLKVAARLRELERRDEAGALVERAQVYLQTTLRRATPTGLLPELMQGPTGQRWWAAPHGWAMSSFVCATLMLARELRGGGLPESGHA